MKDVVVITGSSQGIGAAIAKKCASLGKNIVINYLTREDLALELKSELEKQYNIKAMVIKANVANEDEIRNMVNKVLEEFGMITCLVNNAGIALDNYFEDKTEEEFKKVLNTNLVGTFLTSKYVGMYFKEVGKGNIINIASTNGIDTNEIFAMDYDASKAGVISLTHNFAKALAPNIRVNAIAPGWVKSKPVLEMNPNYIKEEQEKILLKRFAEPEEIANVVAFLMSDEASFVNNSIIRVDGGKL